MSAAPMPGPESWMAILIHPPASRTETSSRRAPGTNIASRALRIRLISACRSCASSAATSGNPGAMSTATSTPACASSPRDISITDATIAPMFSRSNFGRGSRVKRR